MIKVKTVYPDKTLSFNDWAKYIKKQLVKPKKNKKPCHTKLKR